MKILMPVLHYYPVIGGLETWTKNIAERLSRKADIFVVTGKVAGQPAEETKNGVKIFRTSLFPLKNLSYSSPIFIFTTLPFIFLKSLSLVKKEKINLLHCQGFLSAFLGYLVFKICGIPYIATAQSLQGKNWFKKMVYKRAVCCIAASSAIKKYFEEIGCKNVAVIPNGIDLRKFENIKKQPHEGFVAITVARLEKVKGIDYLIRAVKNFQLLIIGDGSERKNLENLTKQLGLAEKVKFLGQISPENIPGHLAMADCFVLPSLKEGFGIAVLEAMATGLPVIASRVGGIPDIVEDGRTGLLAEPGNSQQIAQAIQKIYQNSALREQLINNAMAELKRYGWQSIAERVYEIYQKSQTSKIIFAAGIYPPDIGGPATYVGRLADELFRQGFDIRLITYSSVINPKSQIPNPKQIPNSKFQIVKISRKYPIGLRHILYCWHLLLLAKNADVIYAQNVTSAGLPALLAAKLLKKKFVLKVVGDAAWEQKKEYLRSIQAYVAKNAQKVIVPSQYVKKMVAGWGVPQEKITVIYNAPEPLPQSDISKEQAQQKIAVSGDIILSAGRSVPWKGFAALRSIMPDLLEANPNFRLVIVGEGEKKVPHWQMPIYFRAADVFVLNSGYEGLSHVILEAMQSGLAVVASREGGNPELIEDGFNGFLVEYNNEEQIKSAILKLWRDKGLREKFIKNSKEKLRDFTWENLVEKTIKILEKPAG